MFHSQTWMPQPPPSQMQQFAQHYATFTNEFDLGRLLRALDVILEVAYYACVSPAITDGFYRQFALINYAAVNLRVDDIFKHVRLVFPELFGQYDSTMNLDPAARSALSGPLIHSLVAESFCGGRLCNRAAGHIKELLDASISHVVAHEFIEEFQDLFEYRGEGIDVTVSYKTCVSCLALCQFSVANVSSSGAKQDFIYHQRLIHEFFRAVESLKLYIVNEPLFCGCRLVVMSKFVQFPGDPYYYSGTQTQQSGFGAQTMYKSQCGEALRSLCGSAVPSLYKPVSTTFKPYYPQTHALTLLKSMMDQEKCKMPSDSSANPNSAIPTIVLQPKPSQDRYWRNGILEDIGAFQNNYP